VALVASLNEADLQYVRDLVRRSAGILLEADKDYLIESRLHPLLRIHHLPSLEHLVAGLRRDPSGPLHLQVVEAMTTNETSFFRDKRPFDVLRTDILPRLIQLRASHRSLRIWSAACSSGQEPYSVALIIAEHFPELADWHVQILATDISTRMVARASTGAYNQLEVNRGLPAPFLVKYFEQTETDWRLKTEIRGKVTYQQHNLVRDAPPSGSWDIILLRNVLIYLDNGMKRPILEAMRTSLRPDGYLILGGAETTFNIHDGFEPVPGSRAGCYRITRSTRLEGSDVSGLNGAMLQPTLRESMVRKERQGRQ